MRKLMLAALFAVLSCRTALPPGRPLTPLTATDAATAQTQLRERRASFAGARSLMRIRATHDGRTDSFRGQLIVHDARRMELIAYTPIGTTALHMTADGDRVTSEPDVPQSALSIFRGGLQPAELAMLLLGIPPNDGVQSVYAAEGLREATVGDMHFTFDPPAFPAKQVTVERVSDRVVIEHLEIVTAK